MEGLERFWNEFRDNRVAVLALPLSPSSWLWRWLHH